MNFTLFASGLNGRGVGGSYFYGRWVGVCIYWRWRHTLKQGPCVFQRGV